MKLRVQAQHLQPGDIVGSGEKVTCIVRDSISWPSNKIYVGLDKNGQNRSNLWGKYTMINVERRELDTAKPKSQIDKVWLDEIDTLERLQQEASNDAHYWWRNENANT